MKKTKKELIISKIEKIIAFFRQKFCLNHEYEYFLSCFRLYEKGGQYKKDIRYYCKKCGGTIDFNKIPIENINN